MEFINARPARELHPPPVAVNLYAGWRVFQAKCSQCHNRMKELEAVHLGMMGNLPEEYGGSGAMFWHKTMQCVRDSNR
jgi:hypothetical protein